MAALKAGKAPILEGQACLAVRGTALNAYHYSQYLWFFCHAYLI
jgi:hypothetical protein